MAGRKPKNPELRKSYSNKKNLIFSENVRLRRMSLGLKQSEFGQKIGMRQAQISELEGGRFVDDAERVINIARALETTPDYLFGFREEP